VRAEVSAYEPSTILWYEHATMADLMADLQIMLAGLPLRATLRVRTSLPEAWDALPAWCEAHGYRIVYRSDTYEGALEGAPSYRSSRYLFDIARAANETGSAP
jgi:hypothetical protein